MEVIFQLHRHLHTLPEDNSEPGKNLKKILQGIENSGLKVRPLSFPANAPESNFYRIEIDNTVLADEIVTDLRNNPLVDAAYIKPTDELP